MATSAYQWAKPHALFGLKVIAAQPVQPIARPILQPGIGGSFNPAIFFASGEQGVWYDPSDTATLFQDSAGITPVTAVEQPVGLMLDKSKGLVLGSAISIESRSLAGGAVDNGNGTYTIPAGGSIRFVFPLASLSNGAFYRVSFSSFSVSGGTASTDLCDTASLTVPNGQTGAFQYLASRATYDATFRFVDVVAGTGATVNIAAPQLFLLPGNHAFQSTSTSRPVLSARYNLLTKTEEFDDATFSKKNLTVTANAVTAPNGTLSADLAVPDNVSTTHYVFFPSISTSAACTASVYVQAAGLTKVALRESATAGSYASFDLATGTVIETGNVAPGSVSNATITSVGSGWFRISANFSGTASQLIGIWPLPNSYTTGNPVANWASDGVNGLRLWGADLRVTNDAAGQPAYQRVNTATDYDTTGFKPYLRFDGTDDWMQTNSVNFSSTDKMTVFAGVRKLSDATSIISELSATIDSNNGAFYLLSSGLTGRQYCFSSKGTGTDRFTSGAPDTYAAPTTDVLAGIGNISDDRAALRIDGTQVAQNTDDQGTGNYGNYPLYIGRRGGTTLPFNGRLYGLIVRGAQSTAQQITNTENWLNQRTGAF